MAPHATDWTSVTQYRAHSLNTPVFLEESFRLETLYNFEEKKKEERNQKMLYIMYFVLTCA